MAVALDHPFATERPIDDSFATILDLEKVIPCVEGATVLERTGPEAVKAEIKVKMGAMSLTFTGTLEVTEQDAAAHHLVMTVKSREAGGQGYANATIAFDLKDGGELTTYAPGADDRRVGAPGTWRLEGEHLVLEPEAGPAQRYVVDDATEDRLVLRPADELQRE